LTGDPFKRVFKTSRKLVKEHGTDILDYPLVYASDDEGNDFYEVISLPDVCTVQDFKERSLSLMFRQKETNAIIIN
jgi:hypothetical protein